MDFDLDDPLGSDDSFFEEPKALSKRPSITKSPEKKTLDSLLGFTSKSAENIPKTEADETLTRTKSTVTFDDPKVEVNIKKPMMDDWLSASSAGKQSAGGQKKTDFLDDILSIKPKAKEKKKVASLDDILKESKVGKSKDVNVTETQSDFNFTTLPERRRGRRGSGVEDSLGLGLGLFSDDVTLTDRDKKEAGVKGSDSALKTNNAGVPDWLGLGPSTRRSESPSIKRPQSQPTLQKQEPPSAETEPQPQEIQEIVPPAPHKSKQKELSPSNINNEIQNTYSSLHQQESLLLVSLQFKRYEEVLKEIQEKQKEIIGKQDDNFQKFIDEYLIKQQMVENNIRLQQERINKQIQMLITDPMVKKIDEKSDEVDGSGGAEEDKMVKKIKMRHEEELFLMEESYKKQIDLLEKSSLNIEENLKSEIKNVANLFEEKINILKANYEEETAYYKEKIKLMDEQHKDEMRLVKETYNQKLEELKTEHSVQIEYLKEMKQKESNLLVEGRDLGKKIDTGIEMLSDNIKVLYNVEEKITQQYDVLATAREHNIKAKEREIILMRSALEKSRESAENERSQLLTLIRTLEQKLAEQNVNAQEDRWTLQQASATLTARSKALEREAEYSRNLIERERDHLKTFKESLIAEQEKMLMHLTEEKLLLAAERAKFDAASKITNNFEVERAKSEAEAAIEEAKQLSQKLNQERSQIQRQKNELQALKASLSERERELEDKEGELEYLLHDAQKKLKEDKHVLMEAKRMESVYKEKMKDLQNQWALLSGREKKLAEDKMLLSKERLALYTSMKASKECVLCNADSGAGEPQFAKANFSAKITDPNAMKIRLDALEDEESEVSKEGSHG